MPKTSNQTIANCPHCNRSIDSDQLNGQTRCPHCGEPLDEGVKSELGESTNGKVSRSSKNRKWAYVLIPTILILIWLVTHAGEPGPSCGPIITMMDESSARVYEAEGPGVYTFDCQTRKLVPVRGLKTMWEGIINSSEREKFSIGLKTSFRELKWSLIGIAILITVPLSIIGFIVESFVVKRRKPHNA